MKWFSPPYLLAHLWLAQSAVSRTLPPKPHRIDKNPALPAATHAGVTGSDIYPVGPPGGPASATAFTQPAGQGARRSAKPLTPEEKKYLCYSVADGVGKYMDLLSDESFDYRAKDASAPHPRADEFAARFITIYTEGQKALFVAAGTLEESRLAEDDAIHDTDKTNRAGLSLWWNDWAQSNEKQATQESINSFERRLQHADHFFHRLQQVRNYLYQSFSSNITAAERVQVRCRIDLELGEAAALAREGMTDDGIPPDVYPDVAVLKTALDTFLAKLRRQPVNLARTVSTTSTRAATTTATSAPTGTAAPTGKTARLNLAIGEINGFYASNSTLVMGTASGRKTPNLPELELLSSGVVTYCGTDALDNALKYAPRAHRHSDPKVSTRWKYAAQMFVDADKYNKIPIERLRYEDPDMSIPVPYAKYHDLEIHGSQYRIDKGPWLDNPYPEEDILEQAKYLRLAFLIKQSKQKRDHVKLHDEEHTDRDVTGDSWFKPIALLLGLSA